MKRVLMLIGLPCAHITKAIVNYQDDEQHVAISNTEGNIFGCPYSYKMDGGIRQLQDGALREPEAVPRRQEGRIYDTPRSRRISGKRRTYCDDDAVATAMSSGVMRLLSTTALAASFSMRPADTLWRHGVAKINLPLQEASGQRIASECVTAVDDGRYPMPGEARISMRRETSTPHGST